MLVPGKELCSDSLAECSLEVSFLVSTHVEHRDGVRTTVLCDCSDGKSVLGFYTEIHINVF